MGWVHPSEKIVNSYGFNIIYRYLLLKPDNNAFASTVEILDRFEKTEFLNTFVVQCFEKIEKNQHSDIHISLLLKLAKEQILWITNEQV